MLAVVVLCVAALTAPALGSPPGVEDVSNKLTLRARAVDTSYTVQVAKGWSVVGTGALVTDRHVVCSASLLQNKPASAFSVKVGTSISFFINPLGQTLSVASVAVDQASGVAVLTLAKPVTLKSVKAVAQPSGLAVPGSRAVATGFASSWSLSIGVDADEWVVLPKYCAKEGDKAAAGLCATGSFRKNGILVVDGQLAGLADAAANGLVRYTDLSEASVQKFIADATRGDAPATTPAPGPGPVPQTTPEPKPAPTGKTCKFTVKDLPDTTPLVLNDDLTFLYPSSDDQYVVAAGDRVHFACPGTKNHFKLDKSKRDIKAVCLDETRFLVGDAFVELHRLGCNSIPYHDARRNGTCGDQGQFSRITIGFEVDGGFATQIENCFDSKTYDAVYSRMSMNPGIAGHESGVKRPSFTPASFYEGFSPNALYVRGHQQTTIGKLLGDASLGTKYIQGGSKTTYFLTRGHLSAKADYILGAEQRATFYYVNAAPQWQSFNGDNWEKVEDSVRQWVISSGRTVEIVTGIWGTATLPNVDGKETELYLEGDKKYLRVPKYYWKIVYDPATKEAAAFVGLNNPYQELAANDVLCEDQCARYTWLKWKPTSQESGFGFCCDVNELRKTVTTIPKDLDVKGLL